MYYKLLSGTNIVGVVSYLDFRRFQEKHHTVIFSEINDAEYAQYKEDLFHDDWMRRIKTDTIHYSEVKIKEIDEDEYNALVEALQTEEEVYEEIDVDEFPDIIDNIPVDEDEINTIEFIRMAKIDQLNKICNQTIVNGFDIVLSDGLEHHFSLDVNDQLNLISLSAMVANGEAYIPYHADGELCTFFSNEDASAIMNKATEFKTYITTVCNSLKAYVGSLDTIEEIAAINFDTQIPEEYQSDVLKYFLSNENENG